MVNMLFSLYNFHEEWAKEIVAKYINCNHKVLVIPFSFGKEICNDKDWRRAYNKQCGGYYKSIVLPFLSYGILEENINWINYFDDTKESAIEKVRNSDIIFLTGGLPDKTMLRLKEFDLIYEVENFAGIIIGSSAGAMIQIYDYHITPDKDYDTFSYNKGLNLINDFGIEVHYEDTDLQNNSIKKVLKEKLNTVYTISNTGGIILENNTITLLGDAHKNSAD